MENLDMRMFDRVIDLELYHTRLEWALYGGLTREAFYISSVSTPTTGMKPKITVSGKYNNRTEVNNVVLKVTNFYYDGSLIDYKFIKITMGYLNGDKIAIYGYIFQAYPESAPPDNTITFEVLIGDINTWINTFYADSFYANTSLGIILYAIAQAMNLELEYHYDDDKPQTLIPKAISFYGSVRDACIKLKEFFPKLLIKFNTEKMFVFDQYGTIGELHNIKYIKQAKKDASGFVINTLWDPRIAPMDFVRADPAYYTQQFGGQNITGDVFRVIEESFSFGTTGTDNDMELRVVPVDGYVVTSEGD